MATQVEWLSVPRLMWCLKIGAWLPDTVLQHLFSEYQRLAQLKGFEVRLMVIMAGHLENFGFIVKLSLVPNTQLSFYQ